MKRKVGFTLIEMLIVIVIFGVILAIAIPSVVKLVERNNKDAYNVQMKLINSSTELFVLKNKGLFNTNATCYKMSYDTLKNKTDLKEDKIICNGDIIIYKTNINYRYEYNLTCKDKKGVEFSKKESRNDSCVVID